MTRARMVVGVLVALAGCGDDGAKTVDATVFMDAPSMCPAKQPPLGPGTNVYYLNFEGVSLVMSPVDDARVNAAQVVPMDVVVPPFRDGVSTRQGSIAAITDSVQRALGAYSVDVVTTRPTSGEYFMTVVGGDPMTILNNANVYSIVSDNCSSTNRDRVSIVFDRGAVASTDYATSILSDFGGMLGLSPTTVSGDCLCRVSGCGAGPTPVCTYGADVAVYNNVCGRTTQNEQLSLAASLGCRP